MCIIVPVDHLSCTHTVAIWQHCVDAPKSRTRGPSPCQRIRQHGRPIVTRKLCINCGGPRVFARRGGLADRGWGSSRALWEQQEDDEASDSETNASRYQSDVIMEEDEDEDEDEEDNDLDLAISPRGSIIPDMLRRTRSERARTQIPCWRRNHTQGQERRVTWQPSLKRELTREAFSGYEPESSLPDTNVHDGLGPPFEEELLKTTNIAQKPELSPLVTTPCRPLRQRKGSTLLHPSTPPDQTPISQDGDIRHFNLSSQTETCVSLSFRRKSSTLLHPFTPSPVGPQHISTFPLLMPEDPIAQDYIPKRKGSTLLHPSSPLWPACKSESGPAETKEFPFALPTPPSSSHSVNTDGVEDALGEDHKNMSQEYNRGRKNAGTPDDFFPRRPPGFKSGDAPSEESESEPATIECVAKRARVARASIVESKGSDWRLSS